MEEQRSVGKEIAEDERLHSEPLEALPLPRTLYLGMDGTGIPLRAAELVGRTGKQPDGSAKTGEVKLCTIWSAESLDEEGIPIRDEGSVTYSAALESACALDTAAARSPSPSASGRSYAPPLHQAPRRVIARGRGPVDLEYRRRSVSGGHADRRPLLSRQQQQAISVKLYTTSRPHSGLLNGQKERTRHRKIPGAPHRHRRQLPARATRRCLHYFHTNRKRMRYPEFHAQGFCTSTGVVEAGCKVAIATRLKRAGMHWTKATRAIVLSATKLSGRFQDFWERRSERRAA